MTQPNAFDPSTWGDAEHDVNEARYEPGGDLGPEPETDAAPAYDRDALERELADLRELIRSTQAQRDKAQAIVDGAETELGRLIFRAEAVERDIEASHTDEAQEPTA